MIPKPNTKLLLSVLLLVLWTAGVGRAENAPSNAGGYVSVRGKQFIDPEGNPFLLKGMSLGNWLLPEGYMFKLSDLAGPRQLNELIGQLVGETEAKTFWHDYRENYIGRDDIQFLKRAGFNSVRIPFDSKLFISANDPVALDGPGYALLDRVIGWCREAQLYVVLDMHAAPGGQSGFNIDDSFGYPALFESPASQDLTVALWKKLAERYKNETVVIGFDLLNEPIAHWFDAKKLNPLLEPLYKKITAAIRTVDKHHIVFLGGAQWNTNFTMFGEPFDDRAAYTFHMYLDEPIKETFQRFLDFSDKHNVPLWLGESGEINHDWINRYRTALEKNGVSWCFWPYKKLEVTTDHERVHPYGSCIATVTPPPEWLTVVAPFAALPRTDWEEIRNKRPNLETSRKVLAELLENVKFKNCTVQEAYLKALGLEGKQP